MEYHKYKTLRYKAYSFRLNEDTYDILLEKKKKSGNSWNRFIYSLLSNEEDGMDRL